MGVANEIDSEKIGIFPFTRQLLTSTSFPYATIKVIPSHKESIENPSMAMTNLKVGYSAASNNFSISI